MILRIEAYQEFACYRKPITYGFWESYPLPTISNIRGWFHKVIGAKEYIPMSVGIAGKYESIVYDLQTLIKFIPGDSGKSNYLQEFKKMMIKSPTYVVNLYGVELLIYIKSNEEAIRSFMKNVFEYEYPSIGRREDLVRIDSIDIFYPEEVDFSKRSHEISYGIYLNKETARRLRLKGINYRMSFRYNEDILKKTGIRYFDEEGKKNVVYVDSGSIDFGKSMFDKKNEIIVDLIGDL